MDFLKHYLDLAILGLLGLMSVVLVWLIVERWLYLRRVDVGQFDTAEQLNLALTHNLTTLSSIGANAPYVGLLGTVLGILITFYDLGQSGNLAANQIMLGLALALKATAMGLVVAIPAILAYNGFLRRIDVLMVQWNQTQRQNSARVEQG